VATKRTNQRWVDNAKMDLGETWRCGLDWINLSRDDDRWRTLVNKE
jgi:hypothetical protein